RTARGSWSPMSSRVARRLRRVLAIRWVRSSSAGQLVEALEGDEAGPLVWRCLALETNPTGSIGIEDDDRRDQRLVLVSCVAAGIVELVEDIRVDPSRAPFAVERLCGAGCLDRHVVGMDLGPDAVEQDPALAPDSIATGTGAAGDQQLRQALDDRPADLRADLLAALRDLERGRKDGLAPLA